jgi:hypothetical protein
MKCANLKEQSNGEPWRSRITLRLKPPDALPSRLRSLQTFVDTSWLGTTTIRTLYPDRATFAILHRYLRYQLKGFQLALRIVAGRQLVQGMRGGGPCSCFSLFVDRTPNLLAAFLRIPAPISGNLYSKRYFPVMGAPAPFQ